MIRLSWFDLPSVRAFIKEASESLASSQSTVIVLPEGAPQQELRRQLEVQMFQHDRSMRVVMPQPGLPDVIEFLVEALNLPWEDTRVPLTLANIVRHPDMPQVVDVVLPADLSPADWDVWRSVIDTWRKTAHQLADQAEPPPALCLVVRAARLPDLPETDTHLRVLWWWGFPATLETQLLCRQNHDENSLLSMWRESILPSLAGNDIHVMERLWHMPDDIDEMMTILQDYGHERGWDADLLEETNAVARVKSASNAPTRRPQADLYSFWEQGMLGWTYENNLELHSAALALLDERETILHRIWRGQANLLLPALDRFRLAVCDHLTDHHGADWPHKMGLPLEAFQQKAVAENPRASELGYLAHLFNNNDLKLEAKYRSTVVRARNIRNALAHYSIIQQDEFYHLMREIQGFGI